MKSPLLKLGLILRIYSYVGVFPARAIPFSERDGDFCHRWLRSCSTR